MFKRHKKYNVTLPALSISSLSAVKSNLLTSHGTWSRLLYSLPNKANKPRNRRTFMTRHTIPESKEVWWINYIATLLWDKQFRTVLKQFVDIKAKNNKKLSYRRGTTRCAVTVKTALNVAQMCVKLHLVSPTLGEWPSRSSKVTGYGMNR